MSITSSDSLEFVLGSDLTNIRWDNIYYLGIDKLTDKQREALKKYLALHIHGNITDLRSSSEHLLELILKEEERLRASDEMAILRLDSVTAQRTADQAQRTAIRALYITASVGILQVVVGLLQWWRMK